MPDLYPQNIKEITKKSLFIIVIKLKQSFGMIANYYNIKIYKSGWIYIKIKLNILINLSALKITEATF